MRSSFGGELYGANAAKGVKAAMAANRHEEPLYLAKVCKQKCHSTTRGQVAGI